ncbi:MAG: colanic acid/amylovoran biosynthesis glycosyltransferase [Myxococcales bacterium]|nr:colanic acid/amylovoran biosynthesis glycosyltransferase [Myxococcales bacterium]
MKVAYLVNRYPSTSHTFIRREIQALESLGVEVARFSLRPVAKRDLADPADHVELEKTRAVLSVGPVGLAAAFLRSLLVRPIRLARGLLLAVKVGRRSDRGVLNHIAYLIEACVLVEWLRSSGCGHVHAHFGTNSTAVAMLVDVLGGPPFSFTMHHGAKELLGTGGVGPTEKINRSQFVSAVSSFGRSEVYHCSDFQQWSKVHLVRCGLDSAFLDAVVTPVPDTPRLVCVGRISAQKGQIILIEAAARLAAEGVPFELVFVGDGEMRADVEKAIAAHRLGERVRITGWAAGETVRSEIVAARAFVLPSFSEGLPVAIMEAYALGRPVVSTYVAGIPELIEPGRNGWLVPAGSVDHLVQALREVLEAPVAQLRAMAEDGRRRVCDQHDSRKNARILRDLFEQTSRGSASP